ncbi:hypothetical protein SUGI_0405740 [Cryptomeria japonica]|nr:hypothetical protein SUGI_0405740 [Cryptomeria japonica]
MALGLVLMILILTSQSEWKQQLKNEIEPTAPFPKKQHQISNKHERIKEQIILSQEKKIHLLNELVKTLQQQVTQCKNSNPDNSTKEPVGVSMRSELHTQDEGSED